VDIFGPAQAKLDAGAIEAEVELRRLIAAMTADGSWKPELLEDYVREVAAEMGSDYHDDDFLEEINLILGIALDLRPLGSEITDLHDAHMVQIATGYGDYLEEHLQARIAADPSMFENINASDPRPRRQRRDLVEGG
jgi:hypothetical protein